jgi:tripartite-type tricarboxylate transporter receptor subunit TctC
MELLGAIPGIAYNRRMKQGLLAALIFVASTSAAQNVDRITDNPSRSADWPIVLIVPFPPGGSAERVGKLLGTALEDAMKRPVVARNIPSGAGVDALTAVVNPAAGEIRLGYATNTQIVPGILTSRPATYNPSEDFEWIGIVGTFGNAVILGPSERTTTFEQWLTALPDRQRPVRIGAGAPGSMSMLSAQFLAATLGGRADIVSFAGADVGYATLQKGEIDVLIDGLPNALDDAPRVGGRIVAVTSKDRAAVLPLVPAFGERWPGEDYSVFIGLVVSRRETEAIRSRLKSGWYGVNRAGLARTELTRVGVNYLGLDLEAAPAYMEREFLRHAKLMTRFAPPH